MTTATKKSEVRVYMTEIGRTLDGRPIVIGWDFCKCGYHVNVCTCKGGPTEPAYITKLREPEVAARTLTPTAVAAASGPLTDEPGKITKLTGPGSVSDPATKGVRSATKGPKLPSCVGCSKSVTDDDADKQDDGTWLCFDCQESSG